MTRLVMEGRLKSDAYLHPALGRYYQCAECDALFEVDDLGDISVPVRVRVDFWGHVRCPFCQEWVDLTPRLKSTDDPFPWFNFFIFVLLLSLTVITIINET